MGLAVDETVTRRAARSVKWSALIEVVSRTAPSITVLILARLLTPADFGVVTTAMIVINFCQVLWDAGLGRALVQTQESLENSADVVFWINIALGVLAYGAIVLAAPAIAAFFNSPISSAVLRVLGLQVLIASLASVQQALFVRDLDFRHLFWARLAAAAAPGIVSVPLALLGLGVWALVAGTLTGSVVNLLLVWQKSAWRPRARSDGRASEAARRCPNHR